MSTATPVKDPRTGLPPTHTRSSGLSDVAYREEDFPALRLARSLRLARRIGRALLALLALSVLAMLLAPWQQTVTGTGSVVAFTPLNRRQIIEAPIKGRIVRWGEGIQENALVKKGQTILEIKDVDPLMLERLQQQLEATQRQLDAGREQATAMKRQVEAARTIVHAYEAQVSAFHSVREELVAAADEYIEMAKNKLAAEQRQLAAAGAAREQAATDDARQRQLHEEGLASELKMQLAERKYREAAAKEQQSESYVAAAQDEVEAKQRERAAKEREAQAKIESAEAVLRKAHGDVAKSESEFAKAKAEVTKTEKLLVEMQGKVARQQRQLVTAPRDGYIMRLVANQDGEYVKEGDPLCELVPQTEQMAVQIWVDGNDAPLISPGRHVRLQFEGWPAAQFSGWPSVAVGTFGGQVSLVDATDDGQGRFRVLVSPDPGDQPWPSSPYLRQGARANGWVLLDQVALGYEIWRRMNGFPPALQSKTDKKSMKKPPKMKK